MTKKPRRGRPPLAITQDRVIAVRVDRDLYARLERLSDVKGLKVSVLARLGLKRLLAHYGS